MSYKNGFLGRFYKKRGRTKKEKELSEEREYAREVIDRLPDVSTVVDIGIGPEGTRDLWDRYPDAQFVLIDPVIECKSSVEGMLEKDARNVFVNKAVGAGSEQVTINIDRGLNRSSVLDQVKSSKSREPIERRQVEMTTLDDILSGITVEYPSG